MGGCSLAAEKEVATWWRLAVTSTNALIGFYPELLEQGLERREGVLVEQVPNGITGDALYPVTGRVTVSQYSGAEWVYYDCDTNYGDAQSGGCVPADRDYDCGELRSWGIASIPVIGEDGMLLDDDGDRIGCEPVAGAQGEQGPIAIEECSAVLARLLPPPEEMGLEWTLEEGTVTGGGCRSLSQVAETFENPEQAAADLIAFGWVENAYQTLTYGGDIRISIHRFATPEGAENALEYLSSVQGEPAGTVAVDPALLDPSQRGLYQPNSGWAALGAKRGDPDAGHDGSMRIPRRYPKLNR